MKICKICSSQIPCLMKIDGKVRNLSSRSYCLKCSPFGEHNTRDPRDKIVGDVTCGCGRVYSYSKRCGHSRTSCNSCIVNKRRPPLKRKAVELLGGKCSLCGYDRCDRSLGFHHRDPKKKDFGLGQNMTRSWSAIKKELKKCVLLCANCHGEVHSGLSKVDHL